MITAILVFLGLLMVPMVVIMIWMIIALFYGPSWEDWAKEHHCVATGEKEPMTIIVGKVISRVPADVYMCRELHYSGSRD